MFSEQVLNKVKALEEQWQRDCLEAYGEQEVKTATTTSGIPLKPVYTPTDSEGMEYGEIGLPGEYPYTRGHSPLRYQVEPWMMRIGYAFGSGEDTRRRREFLERLGMSQSVGTDRPAPFTLLIDSVTMQGYDPDEPEARGRVGRGGLSLSTMEDMEALCAGAPLDEVETILIAINSSMVAVAMYIVNAERHGVPQHKLRMKANNLLYGQWYWDIACFPPRGAMKLMVELIKYCHDFMPLVRHQSITGYNPAECGANAIQEVAFTLATAIAITDECIKVGLDPDVIVPGFYGHDHVGMDFFEEIAKFRAKRRMWAKIFTERFGCKNPESLCYKSWPQTAGSALTAQEPLNNIIRVTLMALAGVLAGVDGIWTVSYDEGLCIPTEEAAQIAVRTQQILYHETNIPHVVDPLGGAYYLEWLTNRIEEEVWKLLGQIDDRGGYIKCWDDGWLRREIERSANEHQRKVGNGEKVIVGANKYRLPEQPETRVFKVDPKVEDDAITRVREFRAGRDNEKTAQALSDVKVAAQRLVDDWPSSCGSLMPAVIDAFRADATLGEVQRLLKEVFGYGYTG